MKKMISFFKRSDDFVLCACSNVRNVKIEKSDKYGSISAENTYNLN